MITVIMKTIEAIPNISLYFNKKRNETINILDTTDELTSTNDDILSELVFLEIVLYLKYLMLFLLIST